VGEREEIPEYGAAARRGILLPLPSFFKQSTSDVRLMWPEMSGDTARAREENFPNGGDFMKRKKEIRPVKPVSSTGLVLTPKDLANEIRPPRK